ncbi:MAG: hypothetical protein ACOC0N_06010 [Chroococcales cyanobacterium]
MTSHNEIQSLIAEIDNVLPKADSGGTMPLTPADLARQHRVLEKLRSYLASLQNPPIAASEPPPDLTPTEQEAARRIAQAVVTQLSSGRVDWMQPLRAEVETLKQQRESLLRELRQNEAQRQQQMTDFLNTVSDRIQTLIQEQLNQTLQQTSLSEQTSESQTRDLPPQRSPILESPSQWEQLQQLQQKSDRLLINLDATLRTVFETLERDIQGYQRSLSQGLDKMHTLGQQGEAIFTSHINRWGEQMGLGKLIESEPQIPMTKPKASRSNDSSNIIGPVESSISQSGATDLYPFAGMELVSEVPPFDALESGKGEVEPASGSLPQDKSNQEQESVTVVDESDLSQEDARPSAKTDLTIKPISSTEKDSWTERLFEDDTALIEGEEVSLPKTTEFPEKIETINSLMDLVEDSDSVEEKRDDDLEGESHSPVSSHEVLLSSEHSEVQQQEDWEAYLDGEQLQQLSHDLERFETYTSESRNVDFDLELEEDEDNPSH